MRFTNVLGELCWVNPVRVDHMKQGSVGNAEGQPVNGVKIQCAGTTFTTTEDFESLAKLLEEERARK